VCLYCYRVCVLLCCKCMLCVLLFPSQATLNRNPLPPVCHTCILLLPARRLWNATISPEPPLHPLRLKNEWNSCVAYTLVMCWKDAPQEKKKISSCREEEEKEARAPNVLNRERSRNTPLVANKGKKLSSLMKCLCETPERQPDYKRDILHAKDREEAR